MILEDCWLYAVILTIHKKQHKTVLRSVCLIITQCHTTNSDTLTTGPKYSKLEVKNLVKLCLASIYQRSIILFQKHIILLPFGYAAFNSLICSLVLVIMISTKACSSVPSPCTLPEQYKKKIVNGTQVYLFLFFIVILK